MTPPVRCVECRQIHREKVKNLGRATIGIQQAQSGEGCFLGLTAANLSEIASWGSKFPWHRIAPATYPDQPTAVTFNIDNKLAGIVGFETRPNKELFVFALEYAPWIANYPDARRSLILYMISESIRRGSGGSFSMVPEQADRDFYSKMGMDKVSGSSLYVMPPRAAQKLMLADEGMNQSLISTLSAKADRGDADMAWIARKVAQHKLSMEMVGEITNAPSNINWQDIKRLVSQQSLDTDSIMSRKLHGLFGQLKAAEFLRSLDPKITMKSEMSTMGQHIDLMVRFGQETTFSNCLTYNAESGSVVRQLLTVKSGQGCAIECKTWIPRTYRYENNIDNLEREIRQARSVVNTALVVVSSDFRELDEQTQTDIVRRVTESGGIIKVLPDFSTGSADFQARRFLRYLD